MRNTLGILALMPIILVCGVLTGCGGVAPHIYTILPSQTGFLIPLQDTAAQKIFQSAKYLSDHQIPAHQVQINYHGVGDNQGGTNWYPNDLLVLVDRAAVTRQWTSTPTTGSSSSSQAFPVTSSDGVPYYIESTCTGYVSEQDAATYLFNFPSRSSTTSGDNPDLLEVNSLPTVMDTNVWGRLDSDIARYFGGLPIRDAYRQASGKFALAVGDTTAYFGQRGLTLTACGIQGGPHPLDPSLVNSFILNATAGNQQIQAEARATAQAVLNNTSIQQAAAQATVTSYGNGASLAYLRQQGQLLQQYPGLTAYTYASKFNGQLPQVQLGSSSLVPFYQVPLTPTR